MNVISDIMEDKGGLCKLLAIIYGILGSIGSIVMANILGKSAEYDFVKREMVSERNWPLTIAIFVGTLLVVAMISVGLYTIGEIYDRVYSNAFTANGAISEKTAEGLAVLAEQAETERTLDAGGWRCPDCNKVNPSYVTTCMCGRSKL